LMTLPTAWTGFLDANTTGTSCLGPLAGLEKQRVVYENAVASLADGRRTTLVLVSRAQPAALAEAERTSGELAALGVRNQRLILNGMFKASDSDPVAVALARRGADALTAGAAFLARLPVSEVSLRSRALLGIPALRLRRASQHDRPGRPCGGGGGTDRRAARQPDRSASRDESLRRSSDGHDGQESRCQRPGAARGRPALALHRGNRGVPRVCPHGGAGPGRFRGYAVRN